MFFIHDPQGAKLLSRLRLKFSHLNEHKFRHNFKEYVSPMCACRLEIESTQHFFLRCHCVAIKMKYRNSLIASLIASLIDIDLVKNELNEESIINLVLFASDKYHKVTNRKEKYFLTVVATKRFDEPLP